MSVKLAGFISKEKAGYFLNVMGWMKGASYTNIFDSVPVDNNLARPGGKFIIEGAVPSNVSKWTLYEFDCTARDSKIRGFHLLHPVHNAKLWISSKEFFINKDAGFYIDFDKVNHFLKDNLLKEVYVTKKWDDTLIYGPFDGQKETLTSYRVKRDALLQFPSKDSGFVNENILTNLKEEIDCASVEQLKEWFVNEFELDLKKYINNTPKLTEMEKKRWDRLQLLINDFNLQEQELFKIFERTRNSGFGCKILEVAKASIKDEFKKELTDSNEFRALAEQKNILTQEITSLEEKRNNLQSEFDQKYQHEKTSFEEKIKSLENLIDKANSEYQIKKGKKDQIEEEIKILEEQKKSFRDYKEKIVSEYEKKVKDYEDALKRLKENCSDFINDLKIIMPEQDDEKPSLYPPYEYAATDNPNANALWSMIPIIKVIPSIKTAYDFGKTYGPCKIYELHVEHDWLHYRDFVNHGLLKIWKEAHLNPATRYILVLDSLNLTRPECGLKPLFDCLKKDTPILLGTNLGHPDNLKIMVTKVPTENEDGVGQDISSLEEEWG